MYSIIRPYFFNVLFSTKLCNEANVKNQENNKKNPVCFPLKFIYLRISSRTFFSTNPLKSNKRKTVNNNIPILPLVDLTRVRFCTLVVFSQNVRRELFRIRFAKLTFLWRLSKSINRFLWCSLVFLFILFHSLISITEGHDCRLYCPITVDISVIE